MRLLFCMLALLWPGWVSVALAVAMLSLVVIWPLCVMAGRENDGHE